MVCLSNKLLASIFLSSLILVDIFLIPISLKLKRDVWHVQQHALAYSSNQFSGIQQSEKIHSKKNHSQCYGYFKNKQDSMHVKCM